MSEGDVFGDGKSQAGAAGLTGSGLIDSVEALEEAWKVFRGDARAEVADIKFDAALAITSAQNDLSAGCGILHRILNQVGEDLVDGFAIRVDRRGGNFFDGKFES